jgi:hypothetical protein
MSEKPSVGLRGSCHQADATWLLLPACCCRSLPTLAGVNQGLPPPAAAGELPQWVEWLPLLTTPPCSTSDEPSGQSCCRLAPQCSKVAAGCEVAWLALPASMAPAQLSSHGAVHLCPCMMLVAALLQRHAASDALSCTAGQCLDNTPEQEPAWTGMTAPSVPAS